MGYNNSSDSVHMVKEVLPGWGWVVVQVPGQCGVPEPLQPGPESVPHAVEDPDSHHLVSVDLLLAIAGGGGGEKGFL